MVSTHLAGGSNPSGGTLPAGGFARQSPATERYRAFRISVLHGARFGSAAPLIVSVFVVFVVVVVVVVVVVTVMIIVVVIFGS